MIFLFPFFIRVENYVGTNYVNILSSLGGFALSCLLLRLSFPSFLCRLDDFTGASSPKEKLRQRTGIAKVRRSPVHHTFHSPRQLSRSSHPPPSGYPSIFHSSRRTLSDRYCQLKKQVRSSSISSLAIIHVEIACCVMDIFPTLP